MLSLKDKEYKTVKRKPTYLPYNSQFLIHMLHIDGPSRRQQDDIALALPILPAVRREHDSPAGGDVPPRHFAL